MPRPILPAVPGGNHPKPEDLQSLEQAVLGTPSSTSVSTAEPAASVSTAEPSEFSLDTELARKNIPGFVTKLYRMVDEGNNEMIRWNAEGTTFVVVQPDEFSKHMLPRYFKHGNFSSFVRQLNMYGFHKVPQVQHDTSSSSSSGATAAVAESGINPSNWEFSNPNFKRGRFDLLLQVKRKVQASETTANSEDSKGFSTTPWKPSVNLEAVLTEIQELRSQQDALRNDISIVQRENQMLWNETMSSRERQLHQQQVIEKILRFLASVFVSDKNINPTAAAAQINRAKRQLLLEDAPQSLASVHNIFVPSSAYHPKGNILKTGTSNLSSSFWDAPQGGGYHADQQERIFNFIDTTDEMGHDIDELQKRLDMGTLNDFVMMPPLQDGGSSLLIPSPKKRKSSPVDEEEHKDDFDISNFLLDDPIE